MAFDWLWQESIETELLRHRVVLENRSQGFFLVPAAKDVNALVVFVKDCLAVFDAAAKFLKDFKPWIGRAEVERLYLVKAFPSVVASKHEEFVLGLAVNRHVAAPLLLKFESFMNLKVRDRWALSSLSYFSDLNFGQVRFRAVATSNHPNAVVYQMRSWTTNRNGEFASLKRS